MLTNYRLVLRTARTDSTRPGCSRFYPSRTQPRRLTIGKYDRARFTSQESMQPERISKGVTSTQVAPISLTCVTMLDPRGPKKTRESPVRLELYGLLPSLHPMQRSSWWPGHAMKNGRWTASSTLPELRAALGGPCRLARGASVAQSYR